MKRKIISIDESRCNGCGICVQACHEGALQLVEGKARVVSELYCDGLGACIGHCPQGAITIEEREAEPYFEPAVMERIAAKGEKTILAHLRHLKAHGQEDYLAQALAYIRQRGIALDKEAMEAISRKETGCPGTVVREFGQGTERETAGAPGKGGVPEPVSCLEHWPVQLHLINPDASFLKGADLLLAADCTAFSLGNFHAQFLKGRKLAIACPKLDSGKEVYLEKIARMIDHAGIASLTVLVMEVPCCSGLVRLALQAAASSSRKIPVEQVVVGIQGNILRREKISG